MTVDEGARADQSGPDGQLSPPEVRRFSLRLILALVATVLVLGPFLLLLLLLRGKWDVLSGADTAGIEWGHRLAEQTALTRSMLIISAVLNPWVLRPVASAVSLWCLARGRRRVAWWGLAAIWGGALLDVTVKTFVARARPHLPDPVAHAPGYSFPSGHALGSVVCLGVIAASLAPELPRARPYLWSACLLLVVLVGFARVELGVHYPSDVVAGWLLGTAWLAATAAAFDVWRPAPPEAPPDDSLRTDPD